MVALQSYPSYEYKTKLPYDLCHVRGSSRSSDPSEWTTTSGKAFDEGSLDPDNGFYW
jgi:hypothetical protein